MERIFLDLPEEEKICKETGLSLIKMGEEISYKLAYKPGSYYLKEIVRPKYAYPKQEEKGISIAPMPDSILPRCQADNSLLSDILVRKFADHLPLYRISEIFSREGIMISRKLLSQWVIKCGLALAPLYDEMLREILSSQNIFVDETPIDMQDKETSQTGLHVGGRRGK